MLQSMDLQTNQYSNMKVNQSFLSMQQTNESKKLLEQFRGYMDSLVSGRSTTVSYQMAYDTVYKLTKEHKQTEMLVELDKKLMGFLEGKYQGLQIEKTGASSLLEILKTGLEIATRMAEICLFLDINYCKKELNVSLPKKLGETIFKSVSAEKRALEIIASAVFEGRKDEKDDFSVLLAFIGTLDEKEQFFQRYLLPYYEPLLRRYFEQTAQEKWKSLTVKEYLGWCSQELEREIEFVRKVFVKKRGIEGLDNIQNSIYSVIVSAYKSRIYETPQEALFERLTLPILQLFKLGRNKEIEGHIQWFMTRVEARLNLINLNNNNDFVSAFCILFHKVNALLKQTQGKFQINYRAVFTFQQWINNQRFNLPLRINMLFDSHLRRSEGEEWMDNAILVFRLVKEKNLFESLYRRMMLDRLVQLYSTYRLEQEQKIVELMEKECGDELTKKIKSIIQLFLKNREKFVEKSNQRLFPLIVEESDWPFEVKQSKITLHPQLLDLTPAFETSYLPANKNHRLIWSPFVGIVTLSIRFKGKSRIFQTKVQAANLLLHLQKHGVHLASYLCNTGYKLDEIQGAVQILIQHKVVTSTPKGSDVVLELVQEYPEGGVVDLVTTVDKSQIEVKSMQELKADRKLMVEAILVKIMKLEKIAKRIDLVQKTAPFLAQRGFNFNSDFVQKSIDRLLDKQFLRDFQDGSLGYIA